MWVRGLKLGTPVPPYVEGGVAPHVGAWIETESFCGTKNWDEVAPHVGAWIETNNLYAEYKWCPVAPHVGAWIETPLRLLPLPLQ